MIKPVGKQDDMNTKNVEGLKEAVARIVDPGAAAIVDASGGLSQHRDSFDRAWLSALSKAETILSLIGSSPLSTGLDEEGWVWSISPLEMARAHVLHLEKWNDDGPENEDVAETIAALRDCLKRLSAAPATVLSGGDMSSVAESAGAGLRPGASDSSCQSEADAS